MKIVKLDQIDHVLQRPDMYVGSNATIDREVYVVDDDRIVLKSIRVNGVLYKIFDEILVNARDHSVRDSSVTLIKVTLDEASFTVENNGGTLPIEQSQYGAYVPEVVFGHMLSGTNFDDSEDRIVGGRNGLGAKLANIWSTKFVVNLCDGTKVYRQQFSNNMKKIGKASIRDAKPGSTPYTKITVFPDLEKLGVEGGKFDDGMRALMTRRVYDIAATTACTVKLGTKRVPCSSMAKYAKMVAPDVPQVQFETERWSVIVFPSPDSPGPRIGFVNGIACNAGSHIAHVANQITKHIRASMKKFTPTPAMINEAYGMIVDATIVNPEFSNQQKDMLTTPASKFGSKCELPEETLKKIVSKKFGLIERLEALATQRLDASVAKNDAKKTRLNIPKLDDATWAGTAKSKECTLILCEGDSAKSLAISGLSVVGRKTFGVFPLRGKLVNVRDNFSAGVKNAEIQAIKRILGLEHKKSYDSVDGLRYGRVMIMTDADADGSHIKGLVLNFLDSEFPGLLATPGFVAEFVTPLIKVTKGTDVKSFFSVQEYDEWCAAGDRSAWIVKYYKGLGTSTSKDAREYFSNLDRHVIQFRDDAERSESMCLAFSKKRTHDRKEWVTNHDGTCRRYNVDTLEISEFVHKDLVNFSVADVRRSIPDAVDGMKPSQRKVLFAAFKRKLDKDIKVAQFSGYVSEVAAYHHGESSLQGTIVSMARDYTGSNNLNLLVPSGQFGTRLMGGSDAASARYIFTRLSPETRLLFPARDDPVLEYLTDDGQCVEPVRYYPIIPMVLVNGANGIGTGFSTQIPNFSVQDVIRATRARVEGRQVPALTPSYRGGGGTIEPCDGGFVSRGTFSVKGRTVRVTELPVGTWTQPYKEWLSQLDCVSRLVDESTETSVDIEFNCSDSTMLTYTGLKLETKLGTTNMTLFDRHGKVRKFETVSDIVEDHYHARLDIYAKRKAHELETLAAEIDTESNRLKFVRAVVCGDLVITNRPVAEVEADMARLGIVPDPSLLRMQIRSLTREKVDALEHLVEKLKQQRQVLESTSIDQMWLDDLDGLSGLI